MSVATIRQLKAQRAALIMQRGALDQKVAELDEAISKQINETFQQFGAKLTKAVTAVESYSERQDRMNLEASREDRLRKPAGMDWGTYYKTL